MADEWITLTLTAEDHGAILTLWERAGLPTRPAGRDSRAQFAAQFANGTQTVLGVRDDEHLIAVVVATHDGRKGWINRLAVHPDFRRRGLGAFLITAAERALREQGMQIIAAIIEDWNQPSLALFEDAGYVLHPDIHYLTKREHHDV